MRFLLVFVLLLAAVPLAARADEWNGVNLTWNGNNLSPYTTVTADMSFLPQADWSPGCNCVNFSLAYDSEGASVVTGTDFFTVSSDQVTFVPGDYDPSPFGNVLQILRDPGDSSDDIFLLWGGAYAFLLPSTVTASIGPTVAVGDDDSGTDFLSVYGVTVTQSEVPEPASGELVAIALGVLACIFVLRRISNSHPVMCKGFLRPKEQPSSSDTAA
jgi:hypothetical protein